MYSYIYNSYIYIYHKLQSSIIIHDMHFRKNQTTNSCGTSCLINETSCKFFSNAHNSIYIGIYNKNSNIFP